MKFKVGDKVIGTAEASERYTITVEGWIGTVKKINGGKIDVRGEGEDGDEVTFSVEAKYFVLYEAGENPDEKPKKTFKVGDRVKMEGKGVGTIMYDDKSHIPYAVEFDEWKGGHDCDRHTKPRHGWWCKAKELTKVEDAPSEKKPEPEGEWRVVRREPKAGDYIRLLNSGGFSFSRKGDILLVNKVSETGLVKVRAADHPRKAGGDPEYLWNYTSGEYEVVERVGTPAGSVPRTPVPSGTWHTVGRDARAGDFIRLKESDPFSFNRAGDILPVHRVDEMLAKVLACDHPRPTGQQDDYEWNYLAHHYDVVEFDGEKKSTSRVVSNEPRKKPRSEFYNGKVVCISVCSVNAAYTVGKVYEFIDGRVKIDNGIRVPVQPVKSIEEFNEGRTMFAKFAPLIEKAEDGFNPHLECCGRDYGTIGKPTKFTDKNGKVLFIGDIVRISSSGMMTDTVVCDDGGGSFIMGIANSCDEEANTFGEWSVCKVRPWQDVEDKTICSRVRFVKSPKD